MSCTNLHDWVSDEIGEHCTQCDARRSSFVELSDYNNPANWDK